MFEKSANFRSKNAVAVTIRIGDEPPFDGSVYLRYDERLIDLLNDERAFIPIVGPDGDKMIIAKTVITSIIEREINDTGPECEQPSDDQREKESDKPKTRKPSVPFDPHMILRVSKDASMEMIKTAYKERLKAVHPDSLAALDLDPDLKQAAILSTQRVNRAYQELLRQSKEARGEKENSAA